MNEILNDLNLLSDERKILINAIKEAIRESDEGEAVSIYKLVEALHEVGEQF